jgi:hypothetical protein
LTIGQWHPRAIFLVTVLLFFSRRCLISNFPNLILHM